jgi:hypothetical protein
LPESFRQCSALEIVDLGNNIMREWRYAHSILFYGS